MTKSLAVSTCSAFCCVEHSAGFNDWSLKELTTDLICLGEFLCRAWFQTSWTKRGFILQEQVNPVPFSNAKTCSAQIAKSSLLATQTAQSMDPVLKFLQRNRMGVEFTWRLLKAFLTVGANAKKKLSASLLQMLLLTIFHDHAVGFSH